MMTKNPEYVMHVWRDYEAGGEKLIGSDPQSYLQYNLDRATDDGLAEYLTHQRRWSERTFGPGMRTIGIGEHIRKELQEIAAEPTDTAEWIDVIILAMDGFWRAGGKPEQLMPMLRSKQRVNFCRKWPAPQPDDKATEHIRETT
jgi:hypothetical protein